MKTKLLILALAVLALFLPEHGHGAHYAVFGIDDLLIGGALGLGSAVAGRALSSGDRQASQEQIQAAVDQLTSIGIPEAEARQVVLQKYQSQGQLTPELEQAIIAPDSVAAQADGDPDAKRAEMEALAELQRTGEEGGITLSGRADLEDTLGAARRKEHGAREANLATIRGRGQLGSGLELAAMNDADQANVEQEHRDALRVAGDAHDRALQAMMQSGQLAGQIDQRRYGQEFQTGSAADEIAKFNTQTRQGVQTRNVNRENDAQGQNLQAKQSIADRNVDTANKQTVYNTEQYAKAAQDKLDQAKAVAAARTNQAQQSSQRAAGTESLVNNIGSGLVKLYGSQSGESGGADDEEKKKKLYTGSDDINTGWV
jgi:hypothetical protein